MANFYSLNTRVMNETTTTGTGDITISGTVDGYLSMVNAVFSSDTVFPYVIEGISGACLGEVECGYGQFIGGDLVRDYASSAYAITAGAKVDGAVNFSAGTKRIYVAPLAEEGRDINFLSNLLNQTGLIRSIGVGRGVSNMTTNATPTVLAGYFPVLGIAFDVADEQGSTFAFPASLSGTYAFDLIVTATEDAATDGASWRVTFMVSVSSGTPTLVGSPTPTLIAATAGAAAWDLDLGVSGSSVTLTATGEAATTIYWIGGGTAAGYVGA